MLVLTRRLEEGLVITVPGGAVGGETIVVTVLAVEGDRVKLGIEAQRHVTVLRQELCEAVRQQNLAAARLADAEATALIQTPVLNTVRQLLTGSNGHTPSDEA